MINTRIFTYLALLALVIVLLLSGCEITVSPGKYTISGRVTKVTSEDQIEGVPGVIIHYEIGSSSKMPVSTDPYGRWEIRANRGDYLTIWPEKTNYLFQTDSEPFMVTENRSNVDFQVSGWYDKFSTNSSGWTIEYYTDDWSHSKYVVEPSPSEYEIYIDNNLRQKPCSIKSPAPLAVPTTGYSVEATIYTEPGSEGKGMYGLLFNVKSFKPGNFYYIFRVRPETEYFELIKAEIFDNVTRTTQITEGTNSIFTSNYLNILKVWHGWNQVKLFVNNECVWENNIDEQSPDFYTKGLKVGLYACADAGTSYTARFDNFNFLATGFREISKIRSLNFDENLTYKDVEITE